MQTPTIRLEMGGRAYTFEGSARGARMAARTLVDALDELAGDELEAGRDVEDAPAAELAGRLAAAVGRRYDVRACQG